MKKSYVSRFSDLITESANEFCLRDSNLDSIPVKGFLAELNLGLKTYITNAELGIKILKSVSVVVDVAATNHEFCNELVMSAKAATHAFGHGVATALRHLNKPEVEQAIGNIESLIKQTEKEESKTEYKNNVHPLFG